MLDRYFLLEQYGQSQDCRWVTDSVDEEGFVYRVCVIWPEEPAHGIINRPYDTEYWDHDVFDFMVPISKEQYIGLVLGLISTKDF